MAFIGLCKYNKHSSSRMHHFDVKKKLKVRQVCQLFVHVHTIGTQLWFNLHNKGIVIRYFNIFVRIVVLGISRGKLIPSNTFHSRFVLLFIFNWGYWKAIVKELFVDEMELVKKVLTIEMKSAHPNT
jgi:hypothetical protein